MHQDGGDFHRVLAPPFAVAERVKVAVAERVKVAAAAGIHWVVAQIDLDLVVLVVLVVPELGQGSMGAAAAVAGDSLTSLLCLSRVWPVGQFVR